MRLTITLLVALNLGMVGLYALTFPVYVATTGGVVSRGPVTDMWVDQGGVQHHVATEAMPGETFQQQVDRHKARTMTMQAVFPPRS